MNLRQLLKQNKPEPIQATSLDCVNFSNEVLRVLAQKGFHVISLQDALLCLDMITTEASIYEINEAMMNNIERN